MMTPISKHEEEIVKHYELRLHGRYEYEDTLIDEIKKRDNTISFLKTAIVGLIGMILVITTTYFLG